MKQPCVFIVGAGPGDPSLISVRGRRFLQAADVVIYDHRVHRRLLRLAKPGAERIDVGAAAPKPLEQDAISLLLVEKAREGGDVVEVVAYRTMLASAERDDGYDIYAMLLERQIDAITFTSASTVRNFVQILGRDQAADLLRTTTVACIGPVTAEAAQQLDIETTVMPERYTIPDLVDALVEHFSKEPVKLSAES